MWNTTVEDCASRRVVGHQGDARDAVQMVASRRRKLGCRTPGDNEGRVGLAAFEEESR